MTLLRDYRVDLLESLRDPQAAAEYLTAVLEESDPEALAVALRDVAEAQSLPVPNEEEGT